MKLKNILLSGLSLVLVAALAIGGTVAYLQDDDSDVNVMTLGNVSIEQIEQEWNADKTALQDFTQAKPLYPYVGTLGWTNTEYENGAYRCFTMNNVIDKYVSVKNTGKTDAYVRTIIAFEMGDCTYEELGNAIGASINAYNGSSYKFDGAWNWTDDFVAEIDGKNYNIMVAVHLNAVEPGDTTIPSLLQVYMNKDATNETCEKLDGNDNGTYDILVLSQAVQAAGFENAQTALDTAFGDVTTTTAADWFGGDDIVIPTAVSTAADMKAALLAKDEVVVLADDITVTAADRYSDYHGFYVYTTLDGNGKVVTDETASVYGGIVAKESDSLKNFTYNTNSTYGIFALKNADLVISDLTINKSSVGSAVYCDKESTVTLNNVVVTAPGTATGGNANAVVFSTVNTNVIINSGVYTATAEDGIAIAAHNNATLTVNGGTFVGTIVEANGGDVIIKGGTFSVDPSAYVADGYAATQNANNTWTVAAN